MHISCVLVVYTGGISRVGHHDRWWWMSAFWLHFHTLALVYYEAVFSGWRRVGRRGGMGWGGAGSDRDQGQPSASSTDTGQLIYLCIAFCKTQCRLPWLLIHLCVSPVCLANGNLCASSGLLGIQFVCSCMSHCNGQGKVYNNKWGEQCLQ